VKAGINVPHYLVAHNDIFEMYRKNEKDQVHVRTGLSLIRAGPYTASKRSAALHLARAFQQSEIPLFVAWPKNSMLLKWLVG
jgi:hypothetical protein